MNVAENLEGLRFGKLTVIGLSEPYVTQRGVKRNTWLCKCDCGRECIVRGDYLKRGTRIYCGACTPPHWAPLQNKLCRRCSHSEWNAKQYRWDCDKGIDTIKVTTECKGYWCGREDKVTGFKHREGTCLICGKPTYAHNSDAPIYCEEHKAYTDRDAEIIQNAPMELLFSLITAVFERARDDYIYNTDGKRADAERFLRSEWAKELALSYFDADELISILDEEIANGY